MATDKMEVKEEIADVNADKTLNENNEAPIAPSKDEPMEEGEAPDAEDINSVLMLLNVMDKQIGGKGEIAEVPEQLKGSIKFLVEKLIFVRDLWEDPMWQSILDDMADQKEDGMTPSMEVAIARNIPVERLQQLADSEDYAGAQTSLADSLAQKKSAKEEDEMYKSNFDASQKAGEEYASEMGYNEDEKNALFQMVLDLFKVFGDGKLTKEEFAKVDKMRTFDTMKDELQGQINTNDPKEVLPDKSSLEASMVKTTAPKQASPNTPGMGSLNYGGADTDITQIGKRKRIR